MPSIHIKSDHHLGLAGAKAKVDELAAQVKSKLGAESHWSGNTMIVERSGASGTIEVDEKTVTIDIKLGLMLSAFKGEIEKQIKGFLAQNVT